MALKSTQRTERIVDAAAQLFARQGYHGTSTREIARLAEVSENTLFRHFDHKEDIFWCALRSHAAALKPRWELLNGIKTGDSPQVVLPRILELFANMVNCNPCVIRLIAVAFVELQGKAEVLCRDLISPLFSEISQYLATSVKKGEVVEVDPSLLVTSLMAMVLIHPSLTKLVETDRTTFADHEATVSAYSKFWLDVLNPRLPARAVHIAEHISG